MQKTPWTCSVPEAGRRYFGLGRNASYEAAKTGQIPCMEVGGRKFALIKKLEEMLGAGADRSEARDA